MKAVIDNLIGLQTIDLQVSKLDEEIAEGAAKLEGRRESIEERMAAIAALNEKVELLEKRRRDLEAESEDELVRVKDRQTKLMNVQTNREYQSLLKEIEDGKKANSERDDELVRLLERVEALREKIVEESNLCKEEESILVQEESEVVKQAGKLAAQKEKIVKMRGDKSGDIVENLLKKYNLLREKRNGLAIVGVCNAVCQGCYMNIPPQMFNELLKGEQLLSCPTCNRMMYYKPEEVEA